MKRTNSLVVMTLMLVMLMASPVLAREGSSGSGSSGGSSDDSSRSSSSGLEVEVEHGATYLKPHGGSSSSDGSSGNVANSSSRSSDDSSRSSSSGLEVEVEHGVTYLKPHGGASAAVSNNSSLRGRILLQVQSRGEAWYVNPSSGKIVSLGRPADALSVMRTMGVGISNDDLSRIAVLGSTRSSDRVLAQRLSGKILLQVQSRGEAWYVDPVSKKRVSLGRPSDALKAMRKLGLGISNDNLGKLANR